MSEFDRKLDLATRRALARAGSYTEGGKGYGSAMWSAFRGGLAKPPLWVAGGFGEQELNPLDASREHAAGVAANYGLQPGEVSGMHGDTQTLGRRVAEGGAGLAGELPYYFAAGSGAAMTVGRGARAAQAGVAGARAARTARLAKATPRQAKHAVAAARGASKRAGSTYAQRMSTDATMFGAVRTAEEGHRGEPGKEFYHGARSGALFGAVGRTAAHLAPESALAQRALQSAGFTGAVAGEQKLTTGQVDPAGLIIAGAMPLIPGLGGSHHMTKRATARYKHARARQQSTRKALREATPGTTEYKALRRSNAAEEATSEMAPEPALTPGGPPEAASGIAPEPHGAPAGQHVPDVDVSTTGRYGHRSRLARDEEKRLLTPTPFAELAKTRSRKNLGVRITPSKSHVTTIYDKTTGEVLWEYEPPADVRGRIDQLTQQLDAAKADDTALRNTLTMERDRLLSEMDEEVATGVAAEPASTPLSTPASTRSPGAGEAATTVAREPRSRKKRTTKKRATKKKVTKKLVAKKAPVEEGTTGHVHVTSLRSARGILRDGIDPSKSETGQFWMWTNFSDRGEAGISNVRGENLVLAVHAPNAKSGGGRENSAHTDKPISAEDVFIVDPRSYGREPTAAQKKIMERYPDKIVSADEDFVVLPSRKRVTKKRATKRKTLTDTPGKNLGPNEARERANARDRKAKKKRASKAKPRVKTREEQEEGRDVPPDEYVEGELGEAATSIAPEPKSTPFTRRRDQRAREKAKEELEERSSLAQESPDTPELVLYKAARVIGQRVKVAQDGKTAWAEITKLSMQAGREVGLDAKQVNALRQEAFDQWKARRAKGLPPKVGPKGLTVTHKKNRRGLKSVPAEGSKKKDKTPSAELSEERAYLKRLLLERAEIIKEFNGLKRGKRKNKAARDVKVLDGEITKQREVVASMEKPSKADEAKKASIRGATASARRGQKKRDKDRAAAKEKAQADESAKDIAIEPDEVTVKTFEHEESTPQGQAERMPHDLSSTLSDRATSRGTGEGWSKRKGRKGKLYWKFQLGRSRGGAVAELRAFEKAFDPDAVKRSIDAMSKDEAARIEELSGREREDAILKHLYNEEGNRKWVETFLRNRDRSTKETQEKLDAIVDILAHGPDVRFTKQGVTGSPRRAHSVEDIALAESIRSRITGIDFAKNIGDEAVATRVVNEFFRERAAQTFAGVTGRRPLGKLSAPSRKLTTMKAQLEAAEEKGELHLSIANVRRPPEKLFTTYQERARGWGFSLVRMRDTGHENVASFKVERITERGAEPKGMRQATAGVHADRDIRAARAIMEGKVTRGRKPAPLAAALKDLKALQKLKEADARPAPSPTLPEVEKAARRSEYVEGMQIARRLADKDSYDYFRDRLRMLDKRTKRIKVTTKEDIDRAELNTEGTVERVSSRLFAKWDQADGEATGDAVIQRKADKSFYMLTLREYAQGVRSREATLDYLNKPKTKRFVARTKEILDAVDAEGPVGTSKLRRLTELQDKLLSPKADVEALPSIVEEINGLVSKLNSAERKVWEQRHHEAKMLATQPTVSSEAAREATEFFHRGAALKRPEGKTDAHWKQVVQYTHWLRKSTDTTKGMGALGFLHPEQIRKMRQRFHMWSPLSSSKPVPAAQRERADWNFSDPSIEAKHREGSVEREQLLDANGSTLKDKFFEAFRHGHAVEGALEALGLGHLLNKWKQVNRRSVSAMRDTESKAQRIVADWFHAVQDWKQVDETARLINARDQMVRAKRGLTTEIGKSSPEVIGRWEQAYAEAMKHASPEAKETAESVRKGLIEIGKSMEADGMLAIGTVKNNPGYFPHEVMDKIAQEIRLVYKPSAQIRKFGHAIRAEGTTRTILKDPIGVLHAYVAAREVNRVTTTRISQTLGLFNDMSKGDWKRVPTYRTDATGKRHQVGTEKKLVGAQDGYRVWHYDGHWSDHTSPRLARLLHITSFEQFEKTMEPFELSPHEVRNAYTAAWQAVFNPKHVSVIPEAIAKDLEAMLTPKQETVLGHWITKTNRFWKKQMVARKGLYTFARYARDMNGELQMAYRSDAEVLGVMPTAAEFILGKFKGKNGALFAKYFQGYLTAGSTVARSISGKQGWRDAVKNHGITKEVMEKAWKEFHEDGIHVGRFLGEALGETGEASHLRELKWRLSGKTDARLSKLRRRWESYDQVIEAQQAVARFSKYVLDRHGRGKDRATAARENADTFIEYNLLTDTEKSLRDGLVPFWTFRKGNLHGWWRAIAGQHESGQAQAIAALGMATILPIAWNYLIDPDGEEAVQNDPRNAYLAHTFHINTGLKMPNGATLYLADPLPSSDVARMLQIHRFANVAQGWARGDKSASDAAGEAMSELFKFVPRLFEGTVEELTPLLKIPFEVGMNRSVFYQVPVRTENAPGWVQAGQVGRHVVKSFDRQLSMMESMWFNKSPWYVDILRGLGGPMITRDVRLGRSHRELAMENVFGRGSKGRAPKSPEYFIEQATRLTHRKFSEGEQQAIRDNWADVRATLQEGYVALASEALADRADLLRQWLAAEGLPYKGTSLAAMDEETVARLRRNPKFRRLARLRDRDRKRIMELALEQAL